jgi:hypothetical protein
MKRIKVFNPDYPSQLQKEIDMWIKNEKPEIISVVPSQSGHGNIIVTVLYDDNVSADVKI